MKSDRVSGTPNKKPPTDEIMPDLNHSGIYNTQNSQQTLCLKSIFESCGARMSDNEQSETKRDNASIEKKYF